MENNYRHLLIAPAVLSVQRDLDIMKKMNTESIIDIKIVEELKDAISKQFVFI